jgi:hypothetical protein
MQARANRSGAWGEASRNNAAKLAISASLPANADEAAMTHGRVLQLPALVRESAGTTPREYDARRLRSQREVIRDVMLAAADCDTWLTLGELRALTRYGEASISAQLRHLRKLENGVYEVAKRHREGAALAHPAADGRGECVWEYRVARVIGGAHAATSL